MCLNVYSQNEIENLKKYWNYRDKFRKHFVSIGPGKGEGINVSNIDGDPNNAGAFNGTPWPIHTPVNGFIKIGDGMAQQGDYLAVLATEYKLLHDAGLDVTGTLNELYYAINAIDRLDKTAENYFGQASESANGFIIRDDIDESILQHWNSEYSKTLDKRDSYDGLISGYYAQYNPALGDEGNACSQDQVIAIFLGFAHIKKLVGHVYAQPSQNDPGFYMDEKIAEITEHIMQFFTTMHIKESEEETYQKEIQLFQSFSTPTVTSGPITTTISVTSDCDNTKNWIMVNPVTGIRDRAGSEARPFSYGIAAAADLITGNSHNYAGGSIIHTSNDNLLDGETCIIPHSISLPLSVVNNSFWQNLQTLTWLPDGTISAEFPTMCVAIPPIAPIPLIPTFPYFFCFDSFSYKSSKLQRDYNVNLSLSLAVAGNSWSHFNIDRMANDWEMWIFDLAYAVLNNVAPLRSKAFYANILNSAPCDGPHNFNLADNATFQDPSKVTQEWDDNSRWSHPFGPSGILRGEFNGNDYMWMYNLYQLAFKNSGLPNYQNSACPCSSNLYIDDHQAFPGFLSYSKPIIKRRFPQYLDFEIPIEEYLTHNMRIEITGKLTVQTDLNVCNNSLLNIINDGLVIGSNTNTSLSEIGSLKIKSGSTLKLSNGSTTIINDYSKIIVEPGANLIIEPGAIIKLQGEHALFDVQGNCNIDIAANTSILVSNGNSSTGGTMQLNTGNFTIHPTGVLNNQHCKILLNDYVFNYYHNAQILLTGDDATLRFGGTINLQPNADLHFSGDGYFGFKLNQLPNGDINIFGDASNSITLQGSGKTDKIAEIEPYTYVKASDNIAHLTVRNGAIEMGSQATWIAASSYSLLNLNVGSLPGQGYGSGFLVTAVPNHEIDNVTFTGLYEGLRALMMWGDANYLRVKNSNFIACSNALKFVDKGVILNNVDFKDCQAPIVGVNASTPSILSDVSIKATLGNQPVAINISTTASGTLSLNNCIIPLDASGYFYSEGISYSGPGTMALKCSKIYGESNAIKIDNFASLNLAPLPGFNFGGNNSISSENKGIDGSICNQLILQDGFNEFLVTNTNSSQGPLMSGYFQNYIPTSLFSAELNANHNKWADEQAPLTTTPNGNTLTD